MEPLDEDDTPEGYTDLAAYLSSRFPAPHDAVEAVKAGERVEWIGSIDGSQMRHRLVIVDDGTAVVEQAVFIGGTPEKTLLCAWHQAGNQERSLLDKRVLAALDDLHTAVRPVLEADIRQVRPAYTAPVLHSFREEPEPYGPGMPVFGWRILHPVTSDTTWEDTVDTATWNSSVTMSGWLDDYDHIPELRPTGFAQLLRQHGIPAQLCARCEAPITDRHPRWTGTWITPDSESGPLCEGTHAGLPREPWLGTLTDHEFGFPHCPG
ncbi:hypothetical protein ADK47_16530 [Streptomyces rimosus subsp. rimosus]|nr:hypothetical protein DF17_21695 [Streptomyces rimosus]KOG73090.1 hypothetical protein ADK78_17695 [Kitasatospora aureofaciens]KOT38638.1 hypothetical protein ADK42_16975 [Streptomyces rimosus subsp. rimosus]KOT38739.1 hypothetical protein ADK84_16220 [Streptomyces sp. NRRL WC-3701]KOT60882.1 hypothetical protein ADK45_19150 [Streptomyces rimosus subsp. rimosus]